MKIKIISIIAIIMLLLLLGCTDKVTNPKGYLLNPPRNVEISWSTDSGSTLTWDAPDWSFATFKHYEVTYGTLTSTKTYTATTTSRSWSSTEYLPLNVKAVYKEGKSHAVSPI